MSSSKRVRIYEESESSEEHIELPSDHEDSGEESESSESSDNSEHEESDNFDESEHEQKDVIDSKTYNILERASELKKHYDKKHKNTNNTVYFIYLLLIGNSKIKFGCTTDFYQRYMQQLKKDYERCEIFGVFPTLGGFKIENAIKKHFGENLTRVTTYVAARDTKEREIIQCNNLLTPEMVKKYVKDTITKFNENS
jgi:hypothetical protein